MFCSTPHPLPLKPLLSPTQSVKPHACHRRQHVAIIKYVIVLDPGKGVCADPRGGDATLGEGGPGHPMGDSERQLSLDRGGEKT